MRFVRHLLVGSFITLGVVVSVVLLTQIHTPYAAILGDTGGMRQPAYVHAFVPFVVRDRYATQICISTHAGRPYPPFVVPVDASTGSVYARVQAGVPFVERDGHGMQICISTRSGEALPPFILP